MNSGIKVDTNEENLEESFEVKEKKSRILYSRNDIHAELKSCEKEKHIMKSNKHNAKRKRKVGERPAHDNRPVAGRGENNNNDGNDRGNVLVKQEGQSSDRIQESQGGKERTSAQLPTKCRFALFPCFH